MTEWMNEVRMKTMKMMVVAAAVCASAVVFAKDAKVIRTTASRQG